MYDIFALSENVSYKFQPHLIQTVCYVEKKLGLLNQEGSDRSTLSKSDLKTERVRLERSIINFHGIRHVKQP